jgi:hypothetical protein
MGTASGLVLYRYLSLSRPHEMMTHDDPQSRASEGKYTSRTLGLLINVLRSCADAGAYTTPYICQCSLRTDALRSSAFGGDLFLLLNSALGFLGSCFLLNTTLRVSVVIRSSFLALCLWSRLFVHSFSSSPSFFIRLPLLASTTLYYNIRRCTPYAHPFGPGLNFTLHATILAAVYLCAHAL